MTQAEIKLSRKDNGSHENNWAGIFGFDAFAQNINGVQDIVKDLEEFVAQQYEKTPSDVFNVPLATDLYATVVLDKGRFVTAYPLVISDQAVNTSTKGIEEWQHRQGSEAQVLATANNTYGLHYYAADYTAKKEIYQSKPEIETVLAGVLYTAAPQVKQEGFADDFTGYFPHTDFPGSSLYQVHAQIKAIRKSANENLHIDGYIFTLKIAEATEGKELLVDAFISFDNIQAEGITRGSYISGSLWLQGYMVS